MMLLSISLTTYSFGQKTIALKGNECRSAGPSRNCITFLSGTQLTISSSNYAQSGTLASNTCISAGLGRNCITFMAGQPVSFDVSGYAKSGVLASSTSIGKVGQTVNFDEAGNPLKQ